MFHTAPSRYRVLFAGALSLGLLAGADRAAAQCRVLSAPAAFDPPAGVAPPVNFASRANSMAVFNGGAKSLAVRWNYGFAVYSLANPAAPAFQYFQNLRDSGYPKSGDGSDRTGAVAASDDGQRLVIPWTDSVGYGTIAMAPASGKFSASGDFLPNVQPGADSRVAVLKIGTRYIGFSLVAGALNVADLTNLPNVGGAGTPGAIPSETVPGVNVLNGMVLDLVAFQGGGKSWVVVNGYNKIYLGDVTTVGASVPGLSSGFVWRTLTLADFTPTGSAAWSSFKNVAAAVHPTENVPYVMAEGTGTPSPGLSLVKVDTGVTRVGSFVPAAPYNLQTPASTLIPLDTEVLGLFLSKSAADATKLTALASSDFTRDLSPDANLGVVSGTGLLVATRGTGSGVAIYSGAQNGAWAAGLDCTLSNSPAVPSFVVEKVPPVGSTVPLTSGASVFIGDAVRITPRISPPASAQPLTDWRFDYDFHSGNAADSDTAYPFVKFPDLCRSCAGGSLTPPASIDLVGPCDPRNTTPAAPNPATGAGCWVSATTNSLEGGPDFASAIAPTAATLSFGLEAQNALNGVNGAPMSSLATFNLVWNVPQPRVSSSSILYGDALQDGSDGSPDASSAAWEWYFAPTAGALSYVKDSACTGPTCPHTFPGKGSFGYFLKVPYKGGYVTPDCTKVNGNCTNALGSILVSDVSLALTAPASVYKTQPVISVASQSRKSATVNGSFTYEICLSPCSTTPAGTPTLSGDPFAVTGGGFVNVPMPAAAGTYDLRITYTYTGPAECAAAPCKAYSPSQTGWNQVLVSNAMPAIRLLSTAGTNLCFGSSCDIFTGDSGKAYAYVNGVLDPAPPSGMKWLWGNGGGSVTGASAQGASFSYSTAGTYTITLQGYGVDFPQTINVSDRPPRRRRRRQHHEPAHRQLPHVVAPESGSRPDDDIHVQRHGRRQRDRWLHLLVERWHECDHGRLSHGDARLRDCRHEGSHVSRVRRGRPLRFRGGVCRRSEARPAHAISSSRTTWAPGSPTTRSQGPTTRRRARPSRSPPSGSAGRPAGTTGTEGPARATRPPTPTRRLPA